MATLSAAELNQLITEVATQLGLDTTLPLDVLKDEINSRAQGDVLTLGDFNDEKARIT